MYSDRCKNHGCRQKIPEGTSSAMFDVRAIIAKCCNFLSIRTSTRSMLRELRKLLSYDKHGCFSWENVFGLPQKPWLWREKPEGNSSARFGVRTAAKCRELKRCADKFAAELKNEERESLRRKLSVRNLNFSPSTFTVYVLDIFFPILKPSNNRSAK